MGLLLIGQSLYMGPIDDSTWGFYTTLVVVTELLVFAFTNLIPSFKNKKTSYGGYDVQQDLNQYVVFQSDFKVFAHYLCYITQLSCLWADLADFLTQSS